MSVFNTKQQQRIIALEEAICPRVAARLAGLEKWAAALTGRVAALESGNLRDRLDSLEKTDSIRNPWKGREPVNQCSETPRVMGRVPELGMVYTPGHPVSAFERMKRAQKVRDIAREVLGDNHSYKGTFGDIEVVVRRK
jgi:hypothetical protein